MPGPQRPEERQDGGVAPPLSEELGRARQEPGDPQPRPPEPGLAQLGAGR